MALSEQLESIYTKKEMASILAAFMENGQTPPQPQKGSPVRPKGRPAGRPTVEDYAARLQALRSGIGGHYPIATDVATLAYESGLHRQTVIKLQTDIAFLTSLSAQLAVYFSNLPLLMQDRLTVAWRATLDLHYYRVLIANPGVRLPLYQVHALLWGPLPTLTMHQLNTRNHRERARVYNSEFRSILLDASWTAPLPATEQYKGEALWPCVEGCPVTRAYLDGLDVHYIPHVRDLIGPLPWLQADRDFINAPTTRVALRQIIGLT